MRVNYCNLCGRKIGTEYEETQPTEEMVAARKKYLESHRNGRFNIDYARAILNEKNEITHFECYYEFKTCDICGERLEKAVWKEALKIAKENKGRHVIAEMDVPAFPIEPYISVYANCVPSAPY